MGKLYVDTVTLDYGMAAAYYDAKADVCTSLIEYHIPYTEGNNPRIIRPATQDYAFGYESAHDGCILIEVQQALPGLELLDVDYGGVTHRVFSIYKYVKDTYLANQGNSSAFTDVMRATDCIGGRCGRLEFGIIDHEILMYNYNVSITNQCTEIMKNPVDIDYLNEITMGHGE